MGFYILHFSPNSFQTVKEQKGLNCLAKSIWFLDRLKFRLILSLEMYWLIRLMAIFETWKPLKYWCSMYSASLGQCTTSSCSQAFCPLRSTCHNRSSRIPNSSQTLRTATRMKSFGIQVSHRGMVNQYQIRVHFTRLNITFKLAFLVVKCLWQEV